MRKKKLYLFCGKRELALSKDEILRAHNLPDNPKNRAMVVKVKRGNDDQR